MIAPLYLLADSQLLFSSADDKSFPTLIRASLPSSEPKAAYIGASNSDRTEFYDLFVAAMVSMGVSRCRMVPSQPSHDDRRFLDDADLVLLAGGDVEHGWQTLEQNGLKDLILKKRYDGGILIGTSAGAIQLGLGALTNAPQPKKLDMFGFAPFYVGVHEENEEWWNLRALVNLSRSEARGIGISAGGGAIYWPDGTLEPIRHALTEVVKENERVVERLIVPLKPAASA
jgi:cyanophycinase